MRDYHRCMDIINNYDILTYHSSTRERSFSFFRGGGGDVDMQDWFGLVYWGLTPQQQPGSYQGDDKISFLVEETGVPGGNHRPTASN